MPAPAFPKVAALDGVEAFRARLAALGLDLPCDDRILAAPESPLARTLAVPGKTLGNRWCVQPMEGWDGTEDGRPSDLTFRRWERFGQSGAKLIWGGEATAVTPDGRANPNQLVIEERTLGDLARLRETLVRAHEREFGTSSDLLVGLQLTHSGRYCRPAEKQRPQPQILFRHPVLDRRLRLPDDFPVLSDDEIRRLVERFHAAAALAQRAGFDFVDVKHCHGYLGHEFLSARSRSGPYGGAFENRTRFLREVVGGIRAAAPGLEIGVRLSAFDAVPFRPDPEQSVEGRPGPGIPDWPPGEPYPFGFGVSAERPTEPDLAEPMRFLELLRALDIRLVNVTGGSPYYNPHLQRPALYPPSDGYQPPEDPLVGCVRQIQVARRLKERFPDLVLVGTAYSYLQEYLPHVAQAVVRAGWIDAVGLGRMVLAYPELPRDVLEEGKLQTKRLCRTFSDCTTAPRNGLVSGCYPLDPYYKASPQRKELIAIKLRSKV